MDFPGNLSSQAIIGLSDIGWRCDEVFLRKPRLLKKVLYLTWDEHHLGAYFGTLMNSIVQLLVSITSGVSLWQRSCCKNMSNYCNDNKYRNLRQCKSRFSFILEQILAPALSSKLEELRVFIQISNELYHDVLLDIKFSFGQEDLVYPKPLISSAKSNIQIACA